MPALLLALLLALLPAEAQPRTAGDCPGGQTLDAETLQASGAVYLADLARLFDGLRLTTTDGFAWHPFGGGLPTGSGLAVVVDGEAWPPDAFGAAPLRALPVPLLDLASATWCPGPRLAGGRWAAGGALHLQTRTARPGTLTAGVLQVGNETGDGAVDESFHG